MTITAAPIDLDVTPLSRTIGAEIRGVDLKRPLSPETVAAIRATLLERRVIFFPGAHLEPAEHVAFGRYFGEVTPAHPVIPGIDGHPEVFQIDYSGATSDGGLGWHTDVTFVERPPLGSILNAVIMPPSGGDTMWSDQVAAYNGLSAPMRTLLDGLTAVHDGSKAFGPALATHKEGDWEGEKYTALAPTEHPVIRTHPETGERSLFVNPGFTSHIRGLTRSESAALLAFLYGHSVRHEYTVRYHWHQGDVGFWDNRATQHSVVGDYTGQARMIHRITLRGDRPV